MSIQGPPDQSTLPEYLPWIPEYAVMLEDRSKVAGAQGIDVGEQSALMDPLDQFPGLHIACNHHQRPPSIPTSMYAKYAGSAGIGGY